MKHFYNCLKRAVIMVACFLPLLASAQLNVNSAASAQDLANAIVGSGVTVSNVVLDCAPNAKGIFSNGATTNIGLSDGIVLTSGRAVDAIGPNNVGNLSFNQPSTYNGDADLDPLVTGSIQDACRLSFDFVATSDVISVQYVFGSEEYNEYVCSQYNDVFAFFVTGANPAGGTYNNVNVALVPTTALPVSVNTINNGTPGANGSLSGCTSLAYSSLYQNNGTGLTIQYDGFTVVLTAQIAIVPGQTYSFKFAIADVSDSSLDSGVFIRSQSFSIYNCQAGILEFSPEVPAVLCANDDIADVVHVESNSTATGDTYVFILSDTAGNILAINSTGDFDLGSFGNGNYLIYGLSYDGDVAGVEVGENISDIAVIDDAGCFDITSPLSVSRESCVVFELVNCAPDVDVECGSDLNDFSVTGFPTVIAQNSDLEVVFSYTDVVFSSDACNQTIIRTWLITLGDLSLTCTQVINVHDTVGPVISGVESPITVECIEDIPQPAAATSLDACSGEEEVESFVSQTGEVITTCCLSTATGPGADWSVWLPVLTQGCCIQGANWVFDGCGHLDQYADGTAHIYGTIFNTVNPAQQFVVSLWLENKADWSTWSTLGRNYKNDLNLGCATADHINWNFYELVGGFSTLTGAGALAGDVLYLYHMPANYYFGFQVGLGANNKNCNNGISGWFTYTGFIGGEHVEGHGDVNSDAACEPGGNENDVCPNNSGFTYLYRAVDDCGNATVISQEILVDDVTAPIFNNCPADLTIECSDPIPAVADTLTATDNCIGDITILYLGEVVSNDGPCYTTLTRTWAAIDLCGNRSDCVQVITILDTTSPVLSGLPAGEVYVECDEVPAPADVTVLDNCDDDVIVSFSQERIDGDCPNNYTLIRLWYAVDVCQNYVSYQQYVYVDDTTSPVFDDYEFYTHINCDELPDTLSATDNCGSVSVIVTNSEWLSGGCLGVLYRELLATDECGNTATAEQYVAVQDLIAPELIGVPVDSTLECSSVSVNDEGEYFGDGGVYGVDNCGYHFYTNSVLPVTVTYSEEVVPTDDDCAASFDIVRTWVAIDYCENDTTVSVVFHVVDTTAPELQIPGDYTADCDATLQYDEASAADNCGLATISVSLDTIEGNCPNNYQIVRTFVAVDDCGNASEPQSQTITVIDQYGPFFDDQNSSFVYECDENVDTIQPVASDNCSDVIVYTFVNNEVWGNSCYSGFTRVWTATDECGNSSNFYQSITIQDTTGPVISGALEVDRPCDDYNGIYVTSVDNCNEDSIYFYDEQVSGSCAGNIIRHYVAYDICQNASAEFVQIVHLFDAVDPIILTETPDATVECGTEILINDPTFSDNCDDELIITPGFSSVSDGCTTILTYSWTAMDHCQNEVTSTTVITIVDTTNPYFVEFPSDLTVSCDEETPAVVYPLAFDGCDNDVEIEIAFDTIPGACPQELFVYRTFRGIDNCGNQVVETQTIHVIDETAPIFNGDQIQQYTYECDQQIPVIQPSASDNCGAIAYSYADTSYYTQGCYSGFVRIWTAIDECGNDAVFYQFISIQDTTAPVVNPYSVELSMPCDEIENAIFISAVDNCNAVEITYNDENVSGGCAGHIIRTYHIQDVCGNVTPGLYQQIIILTDSIAPVGNEPLDITVECDEEIPAFNPEFTDNCTELIFSHSLPLANGYCNVSVTESWTATDNCGNTTTIDRVITFVDETDPIFTEVPADLFVECDQLYVLEDAIAEDNCDLAVSVSVSAITTSGECPASYVTVRTFTAVDECGNTATATQTITVTDSQAPIFYLDQNTQYTYECDETAALIEPSAFDYCSEFELSYADTNFYEDGCYNGFVRVWTAEDACGNASNFYQYINFQDTTAPVVAPFEANIEMPCDNIFYGILISATDNCNGVNIDYSDSALDSGCAGSFVRTYTVSDDCGNYVSEPIFQTVTLIDNQDPIILNPPSNLVVECGDQYPAYVPQWSDNCDQELILNAISGIAYDGCNQIISQVYFAEDHCGNQSSVSRSITIVDTTDPIIISTPVDLYLDCEDEIPVSGFSTYDACDDSLIVTFDDVIVPGNCPASYTIDRTFTSSDNCGNSVSYLQHIFVMDITAPEFTFVPQGGNYSCEVGVPNESAIAEDNCSDFDLDYNDEVESTTLTINFAGAQVELCGTLITRTWTAEDVCGNTSTSTTVYFLYDNVAPSFDQILSDVTVECASEIPAPVEVTATDLCSEAVVTVSTDVLESDSCGNQIIGVYYTATDLCGNEAYTSYHIVVNDTTDPILFGCPQDVVLACDALIPAAAEVTATDNCDASVDVNFESWIVGDMPAEGSIADCDLITPVHPNSCGLDPDWAMVMYALPVAHRFYSVSEGSLVQYPDGSIHLVATMNSISNPANGWLVDVWFSGGFDWAEWSTQNFPTGFKDDCGGEGQNHEDWTYYLLQSGAGVELTGFGAFTGSSMNASHAPSTNYFGFQLGDGANNVNGADNGFGGWFHYNGIFMGTSLQGAGDFAFELDCCPDYYVVRQWTAVDCSGNFSSCIQNITFEGTEIVQVDLNPTAPLVASEYAKVNVSPNPASDKTMFTFTTKQSGKTTLEVLDMAGAKVADVYFGVVESGAEYKVSYDVNNLATGVYMYRLTNGSEKEVGRLIINK